MRPLGLTQANTLDANTQDGANSLRAVIQRKKLFNALFAILSCLFLAFALLTLLLLIFDLFDRGFDRISWSFMASFPSRFPAQAGILSAWVGSLCVMFVTALTTIPLGIAAGIYLEEYAPKNGLTTLIELNITNLAGIPSIIYGLMALGIFVYQLNIWIGITVNGSKSH